MHQCLTVAEILENIVAQVGFNPAVRDNQTATGPDLNTALNGLRVSGTSTADSERSQARKTGPGASLAALARTCKTISGVALDALWHTHIGLSNVVRCLPDDTWTMSERGEFALETTIGADDWERFDYYARRIRVLRIVESDHKGALDSILQTLSFREVPPRIQTQSSDTVQLSALTPGQALVPFPALVSLSWYSSSLTAAVRMRLFFGPELRTLTLSCTAHLPIFEASLTYLPVLSPKLEDVQLQCFGTAFTQRASARFGASLGRLTGLRKLMLNMPTTVPLDALRALPELGLLEELTIGKLGTAATLFPGQASNLNTARVAAHISTTRLRSLKFLAIREVASNDLYCCSLLLRSFPPPRLETLVIETEADTIPTARAISDLTHTIGTVISPGTFKYLQLLVDVSSSGLSRAIGAAEQLSEKMDIRVFEPLLGFHELRQLDFSVPPPEALAGSALRVSLDDAALERMASAWPALQRLSVQGYASRSSDALPTIDAFAMLVQHCPHLEDVRIDFDASALSPPVSAQPPAGGSWNTRIQRLHVQRSKIADALRVAVFLLALFPNLTGIHSSFGQYEDAYRRWRQVEEIIPTLTAFRTWNRGHEL